MINQKVLDEKRQNLFAFMEVDSNQPEKITGSVREA